MVPSPGVVPSSKCRWRPLAFIALLAALARPGRRVPGTRYRAILETNCKRNSNIVWDSVESSREARSDRATPLEGPPGAKRYQEEPKQTRSNQTQAKRTEARSNQTTELKETKREPRQQAELWREATKRRNGKVPSGNRAKRTEVRSNQTTRKGTKGEPRQTSRTEARSHQTTELKRYQAGAAPKDQKRGQKQPNDGTERYQAGTAPNEQNRGQKQPNDGTERYQARTAPNDRNRGNQNGKNRSGNGDLPKKCFN